MSSDKISTELNRRQTLGKVGAFLGGLALLNFMRPQAAQAQTGVTLVSRRVARVPTDPGAGEWAAAQALDIPMSSQVVVKPRIYEAGVNRVSVRSLYDDEKCGFLLEWDDAGEQIGIGRVGNYRDAVALEFPADSSKPTPYFGMGQPGNQVVIYQWKSDWEFGPEYDVDDEFKNMVSDHYPGSGKAPGELAEGSDYGKGGEAIKSFNPGLWAGNPLSNAELKARTPVEKLTASGFGSLTSASRQDGLGKATRHNGGWRLAITIPRKQDDFDFATGKSFPIAFAAWDGANEERGAEKAVSTWYFVALEESAGSSVFLWPAGVIAVVAAVEWLLLRRIGKKAPPGSPSQQ